MARKDASLLAGIGASGNGKSTALDLVHSLICGGRTTGVGSLVCRKDVSRIIVDATMLHGPIGDSARKSMSHIRAGRLVPDDVVIPIFLNWLETQLAKSDPPNLFLIGGLPRTAEDQLSMVRRSFGRIAVFDQPISQADSRRHIHERLKKAGRAARADDQGGDEVIEQRWVEHCQHTPQIMKVLKGAAIPLDRSKPLVPRLTDLLEHLKMMGSESPVPQGFVRKCLNRIRTGNHPIHQEIAEIESPSIPSTGLHPAIVHAKAIPMPGQCLAPA